MLPLASQISAIRREQTLQNGNLHHSYLISCAKTRMLPLLGTLSGLAIVDAYQVEAMSVGRGSRLVALLGQNFKLTPPPSPPRSMPMPRLSCCAQKRPRSRSINNTTNCATRECKRSNHYSKGKKYKNIPLFGVWKLRRSSFRNHSECFGAVCFERGASACCLSETYPHLGQAAIAYWDSTS